MAKLFKTKIESTIDQLVDFYTEGGKKLKERPDYQSRTRYDMDDERFNDLGFHVSGDCVRIDVRKVIKFLNTKKIQDAVDNKALDEVNIEMFTDDGYLIDAKVVGVRQETDEEFDARVKQHEKEQEEEKLAKAKKKEEASKKKIEKLRKELEKLESNRKN